MRLIFVLLIALSISLLSGCDEATPDRGGATDIAEMKPVDIEAEKKRLFSDNPGATAIALLDRKGKGFVISKNGEATFIAFGAKSDLRTDTTVTEQSGNRICLAKSGGWGGACIEVFSAGSGSNEYVVRVKYGNRRTHSYNTQMISYWEGGKAKNVYEEITAFQTVRRGPRASKGIVYYFAGHTDSRPTPMNDNIVPPYVTYLNKRGWDVFRANPPIALRDNRNHQFLAQNMNRLAADAKSDGYRKVVLVGQSFGSFGILTAARYATFDKFIAVAPASGGTVAKGNRQKNALMSRIRPFAASSIAPGVIFLFENDEYYRTSTQVSIASEKYPIVHVEDRPSGFSGHGSAWLDAFEFVYGDCLVRFIESNSRSFRCAKPRLNPNDHRWMTNVEHLQTAGAQAISSAEVQSTFVGNTLAGRAGSEIINAFYIKRGTVVLEFRSGYNRGSVESATYGFNGKNLCVKSPFFRGECYGIYKWPSENLYFAVAGSGEIVFRGRLISGNARGLE